MFSALVLAVALHAAPADSITGGWQIKGDVVGNPVTEDCQLKQTGTALTGSCVDSKGQPQPLTGQIKDGTITFQHGGEYDGQALTMIFTAKLLSPTQIKGTIEVKPFDVNGEFTAQPIPAKH